MNVCLYVCIECVYNVLFCCCLDDYKYLYNKVYVYVCACMCVFVCVCAPVHKFV